MIFFSFLSFRNTFSYSLTIYLMIFCVCWELIGFLFDEIKKIKLFEIRSVTLEMLLAYSPRYICPMWCI